MPLAEGTVFAGYVIQRLLGAGGMGEVYLARHPRLPRLDAVKILPSELTDDADYRERFNREADVVAALWHPNVVGVHDRGEFNGQLWISMDYVEGTDAGRLLRDRFPTGMPEGDVIEIVTAVAEALDFAHRRGLLHRDVKPGNILLTEPDGDERRILLADFGIARKTDDISGLTATNMTVGSLAYAAPEQLMGEEIDGRADQYALAATAFALLTGAPPFPQSNPAVVISRHLNTPAPSPTVHRSDLAHLDASLSKALAKDPNNRYRRCLDFARALSQAPTDGAGVILRKVFISYARANKPDIDRLAAHVNELGWQPWVDASLHGGQAWWEEILRQIEDCDIFLATISREALISDACEREFDWAEALGKQVLPVAVEPAPAALPRRYSRRQFVDYSEPADRDRAAIRLSRALSSLQSAPPPPTPRTRPQPPAAPLSYLTDLIDLASSRNPLDENQQRQVLLRLEAALRSDEPRERQGGREVLERFSGRDDLYAGVYRRIVELKRPHDVPREPRPPRPKPVVPAKGPQPPPKHPVNLGFRQSSLALPAVLIAAAALINTIPPIRALKTNYQYDDIEIWYWQTLARILIGISFCILAWKAKSFPKKSVMVRGWLMAPVILLYAVNDIAVLEGIRSGNVNELLRVVAYPTLLALTSLVGIVFGVAVNRTERFAWASILIGWGWCGLLEALLSFIAKKDMKISEINEISAPVADSVLILQNLLLLTVAIVMYLESRPVNNERASESL